MRFSVIVPVYNAEQYLEKCIRSVIEQEYTDWELILIDDGSEDNSSKIISDYCKSDKRIISWYQDNAGPGLARNKGIELARGDYIIFLDADDYIDREYLLLLSKKSIDADLVFIDVFQVAPNGRILCNEVISRYRRWEKDRILRSQLTGRIAWGGVRKAVRRRILLDNNIWYSDNKIGEEALYSFRVLQAAKTVDFIDEKPVYYYVNHEGSQSKIGLDDPWGDVALAVSEYTKNNGTYNCYANTINAFKVTALVVSIDRINRLYSGEKRREVLHKRMIKFKEEYDYNVKIDSHSMSFKAKVFIPFVLSGFCWPIVLASNLRRIAQNIKM